MDNGERLLVSWKGVQYCNGLATHLGGESQYSYLLHVMHKQDKLTNAILSFRDRVSLPFSMK